MKATKKAQGVLYVRTESGIDRFYVSPNSDRVDLADGSFVLLSDLVRLDSGVWYMSVSSEAFREWSSFAKSLRSVTLSALFDDASDISSTIKNTVFGGLLILVFVVLFQVNGMRGNLSAISAQLTQVQSQIVQPVELRIPTQ